MLPIFVIILKNTFATLATSFFCDDIVYILPRTNRLLLFFTNAEHNKTNKKKPSPKCFRSFRIKQKLSSENDEFFFCTSKRTINDEQTQHIDNYLPFSNV